MGDVNRLDFVVALPQVEHLGLVRELQTDDTPIRFVDDPLDLAVIGLRRDPMPEPGADIADILEAINTRRQKSSDSRQRA